MSESKLREEFEAAFPVPNGMFWNGAFDVYLATDADQLQSVTSMLYRARWEAWKASRESLVIELPEIWDFGPSEGYEHATLIECLKSQGLKVSK
ncbi:MULTISPECIES: hypothetical protein [unclassified Pseudomonas]|uniref:hypothetical protein n=1 Tax=unclassified Pseudomonas TaxID=196821 RepID=UPI002B23A904|nr:MULTISPECIES: hypothetical protein [unclassified Pseudomonas]MEA9994561.1 hypothetical protein [Pseudomonas sp. AA4]MEB0085706.1 hypothetical protein [Pseudomonas sp. RTI1]MEB0125969.1 hypothetical protein [Pseudomonas sp. CCC1.2]MEB0152773.1 hypothetical protein [Pseudomonas sp. CCC4.3]MEB0221278.1 hypothetical protein [Pseudomonas sp. AB12(2023)]